MSVTAARLAPSEPGESTRLLASPRAAPGVWNWRWPLYSLLFKLRRPPAPSMTNEEFVALGPLKRWRAFGIIPWRFFIHVALFVVFTLQVDQAHVNDYFQGTMRESLQRALVPEDSRFTFGGGEVQNHYFEGTEALSDMAALTENYFALGASEVLGDIGRAPHGDPDERVPTLQVRVMAADLAVETVSFDPEPHRPLGDLPVCLNETCREERADFFGRLVDARQEFEVFTYALELPRGTYGCFHWTLTFSWEYKDAHRAELMMGSATRARLCPGTTMQTSMRPLDVVSTLLAALLCVSSLRALLRPMWVVLCAWPADAERQDATFGDRLHFTLNTRMSTMPRTFHFLILVATAANISFSVLRHVTSWGSASTRVTMGLGLFVHLVCLPYYASEFAFHGQGSTFWIVTRKAMGPALRILGALVPCIAAYVTVGTVVFGPYSDRFKTLGESCVTLFATINGDEIRATFESLQNTDSEYLVVLGRLYLMSFVVLFIYGVLTMVIAVMETAYNDHVRAETPSPVRPSRLRDSFKRSSSLASQLSVGAADPLKARKDSLSSLTR